MGACWSCLRACLDLPPPINRQKVDLSHFDLHRVLGKGGFGKVQVVQSRLNGRYYALKSIRKAWLVRSASNVQSAWLERHIMVQLRSRFLVPVYFAFQDAVNIYLVMHFMPGGDLHFLLQNKRLMAKGIRGARATRPLPESHARFYVAEILLGLEEMHSYGLVYRDCKPENGLLDAKGHVRLSDFGLAGDLNIDPDGKTVGACGTNGYMSQELLANCRYDSTPDVFALGVVLYELLHGFVPAVAEDVQSIPFDPKLSPECVALTRALLQPDPAHRLGCDPRLPLAKRWGAVKAHPFFASIDWSQAARGLLDPPFVPEADTANCDPMWELEEQLKEDSSSEVKERDMLVTPEQDKAFTGWEWHTDPKYHTRTLPASEEDWEEDEAARSAARSDSITASLAAAPNANGATRLTRREDLDGIDVELMPTGSAVPSPMAASSYSSSARKKERSNGTPGPRGGGSGSQPHHHHNASVASSASSASSSASAEGGLEQEEMRRFLAPMPAQTAQLPGAGQLSLVHPDAPVPPLPVIHQNPNIDAFTHHYAASPALQREDELGSAPPMSSPAPSASPPLMAGSPDPAPASAPAPSTTPPPPPPQEDRSRASSALASRPPSPIPPAPSNEDSPMLKGLRQSSSHAQPHVSSDIMDTPVPERKGSTTVAAADTPAANLDGSCGSPSVPRRELGASAFEQDGQPAAEAGLGAIALQFEEEQAESKAPEHGQQ